MSGVAEVDNSGVKISEGRLLGFRGTRSPRLSLVRGGFLLNEDDLLTSQFEREIANDYQKNQS